MALGTRLRRWRGPPLAAAVIVVLVVAPFFATLPLRETDKADAARSLVAWIVEGRSVPGFGDDYPDAQHMPKRKRFFVFCEFVPAGVSLSDDPRVQKLTARPRVCPTLRSARSPKPCMTKRRNTAGWSSA